MQIRDRYQDGPMWEAGGQIGWTEGNYYWWTVFECARATAFAVAGARNEFCQEPKSDVSAEVAWGRMAAQPVRLDIDM